MSSVLVAFIAIACSLADISQNPSEGSSWHHWHNSITPNVQGTLTFIEREYKPKENRKLGKEQQRAVGLL